MDIETARRILTAEFTAQGREIKNDQDLEWYALERMQENPQIQESLDSFQSGHADDSVSAIDMATIYFLDNIVS